MKLNAKIKILLIFGFFLAVSNISNINNSRTNNVNNGMSVEHDDNTISKRPKQSGYWNNFSFIHIDGNWSTAAGYEWCSGNGSWGNPYTIENITMDASSSPTDIGIFINNSKNVYFRIYNCTVTNAGGAGIKLENTNNGTLTNNNCSNNTNGILLSNNCDNNTISGNNISYNGQDGIYIDGSVTDYNTIEKNKIKNNGWYGIELFETDRNSISDNNITNNGQAGAYDGIYLLNSHFNNITGNQITNHTEDGIKLNLCYENLLYNNMFINNTIHARDSSWGSNFWNNSVIGNYWDNYTGFDVNRDGIGDTPHDFIGGTDYLPKWTISNSNVSIDFPINNTLWATPPPIKIRTFHPFNHSNWYNVSGNPNIVFLQNDTQDNMNISLWNSLPEGQFQISFYFNDTIGTIYEKATYTLYKDSQAPSITLSSPSDGEYFSVAPPSYNVQFADQYPITMWYSFNNLLNITFTTNGTLDLGNWTALPEGPVTLRFHANDTLGNLRTTTINIFKDTIKPSLTLSAPKELEIIVDQAPEFDLTISDASPCSIWYSLNNGRNVSCSAQGRISSEEWNAIPDGVIRITFYVQDAAGNFNTIERFVQKTTTNLLLILIIILAVALAVAGAGLLARRSRFKTRERDVKILGFLEGQKSAITESDISIYKEQHICLVHKGKIDGISYICPSCGSFYCLKCYDALMELENECWSCRNPFDASRPVKSIEKYKSVGAIDDGKKKKGLPKVTKEVRETPKSIEDGVETKGILKSTKMAKKAVLKRARLMATTAPKLKQPIQKMSLKSQPEINQLEQKIDYVKMKLEDIEFSAEIGLITEEKYLKKKESLEPILNSLKSKLGQLKK